MILGTKYRNKIMDVTVQDDSGGPSRKYEGGIAIYVYKTSPIYWFIYVLYHIYIGNNTQQIYSIYNSAQNIL
jgi:hypothetical protein